MRNDEGKNYIMSVDSFIDTFSLMDASKTICFSMEMQKREKDMWEAYFSALWEGDRVLVYRRKPLASINVVLAVVGVTGKQIKFEKKLEVARGYEVTAGNTASGVAAMTTAGNTASGADASMAGEPEERGIDEEWKEIAGNLEEEILTEISDDLYENICRELIAKFVSEEFGTAWETLGEGTRTYGMPESAAADGLEGEASKTPEDGASDAGPRVTEAENVLLYGVPGAGKSHEIRENYCDDFSRMERVVFHPDYTYSDFVGQILPKVEDDGRLKYEFVPGPFTRMLKRAWEHPTEEYYLVIEEINRGNAPAIFGEIFQLLDRKTADDGKYDESEYGESEYGIFNEDVAEKVYGDKRREVRIPSNMWILATMNTADQNVFTMDTAFQRRWDMRHIKNDVYAARHAGEKIEGSGVTWGDFAAVINGMILESGSDMGGFEDKRLGAYFVRKSELSEDKFPEKVLKYLWEDAFKMERETVFDEKYKSLDQMIDAFSDAVWDVSDTARDALEVVLRPEVYQRMKR